MIKLKRSHLNQVYALFDNKAKLNKIEDAAVRKLVLRVILDGKKESAALQNDIDAARTKFFDEFTPEDLQTVQGKLNEITNLLQQGKPEEAITVDNEVSTKYPEITKAFISFQEAIKELEQEEVELNVNPVLLEQFVDAMVGQEIEVTGKLLEALSPLFENESEN